MKRFGYTMGVSLLAVALLSGCGNKDQDLTVKEPGKSGATAPAGASSPSVKPKDDVLNLFELHISQAKDAREVISFMDENIKKVDKQKADKMIMTLEQFYEQHLPGLNANFATLMAQPKTVENLRELGYPIDFNRIQNDDSLKQWLVNQVAGKLALDDNQGDYFWKIDYEALKSYSAFLTDDMNQYVSIKAVESNKKFYSDGSLKITRDELANRIMLTEQYLTKFADGKRKTEIKALYLQYLLPYIHEYRYDAIDEKTMKLLPEVKQSYERLVTEHPESKTTQIVTSYLTIINQNQDVIYSRGSDSIIGEPKANIATFWDGLNGMVDRLFKK